MPWTEPDRFARERPCWLPLTRNRGGVNCRAAAVRRRIAVAGQGRDGAGYGRQEVGEGAKDAPRIGDAHVDVAQSQRMQRLDDGGDDGIAAVGVETLCQEGGRQA